MNPEELARRAAEIGLDLTSEELTQFVRATVLARRLAAQVPRDLPLDEEPALTLRVHRRVPR
ncbi:MAG TPA: hypothetical protein VGF34_15750 [Stellaceae bacterium]|jgi:hypothetical protein